MSGFHPRDLIAEIKCRPGIYNNAILEHPRRDKKHLLWLEVGEKLTPREDWESYTDVEKDARIDEIQAKWKHLKDHFYREIKVLHEGSSKKRKYVYFDDMEFMRPFVGLRLQTVSTKNEKSDLLDDSSTCVEDSTTDEFMKMNDSDYVMEELLKGNDSNNDEEYKPSPIQLRRLSQRQVKPTQKALARKSLPANTKTSKDQKVFIKSTEGVKSKSNLTPTSESSAARSSSTSNSNALSSLKIRDGDISFCLSLVPTFRKLNDSSKLRAKIEVLKILHKFVDHVERNKVASTPSTVANTSRDEDNCDDADIIQEDHLDDGDVDEVVSVKHEHNDDPLTNNASGNTKAWWT